jgi:hypothetical protein
MFRTSILASLVLCFTSVAIEDARQLTCSGMMIEPPALSQSPETVILILGPARKVTLDLGRGATNARLVSDNKIQLKFRTKDFEGEYFHRTKEWTYSDFRNRRLGHEKNRLSISSVVRMACRCASGKRRCVMHASKFVLQARQCGRQGKA